MKYLLVIGDGMADDPIPELDGKTPLEYADIPTLDMLAGAGAFGNVKTTPEGMQAGSDTAILSIFGYDPRKYYFGRAPLEAAAMGIRLQPGDVAYRCNMVAVEDGDIPFDEKKILSHSAGAISGEESDALILDLFNTPAFKEAAEQAGVKIYPGSSFRHIAVQTQGDLGVENIVSSSVVTDGGTPSVCAGKRTLAEETIFSTPKSPCMKLTPPHDHLNEVLGQYLPCGSDDAKALERLMRLSNEILDNHPLNNKRRAEGKLPANCIWFWAEGTAALFPSFNEKYGKTGSVISGVPLCQGIGMVIGLERILVEGATGDLNTNYEGKVDAAISALNNSDFVAVHVEAPDECTHNGDLKGKLQAIEWVDSRVLAPIMQRLSESGIDYRMLVMSDHRTLLSTRGHDGGLVPYAIYDSRIDIKTGLKFCESDANRGTHAEAGTELMDLLFNG